MCVYQFSRGYQVFKTLTDHSPRSSWLMTSEAKKQYIFEILVTCVEVKKCLWNNTTVWVNSTNWANFLNILSFLFAAIINSCKIDVSCGEIVQLRFVAFNFIEEITGAKGKFWDHFTSTLNRSQMSFYGHIFLSRRAFKNFVRVFSHFWRR